MSREIRYILYWGVGGWGRTGRGGGDPRAESARLQPFSRVPDEVTPVLPPCGANTRLGAWPQGT